MGFRDGSRTGQTQAVTVDSVGEEVSRAGAGGLEGHREVMATEAHFYLGHGPALPAQPARDAVGTLRTLSFART